MSRPLYDCTAYGLHVRTPFALPYAPAPGVPDGEPDVTVRIGAAPAALPAPAGRHGLWETAPGAFLMHAPGVARYLVTGGRDVLVEPCGGGDRDVGVFLAGPVFAALLQQRGVVTFHAAAIETGTGAVLLAGPAGGGKSSLLAALVDRGYAMLADDVTGVAPDADGRPAALPAFPCLQLWADALDKLAWRGRARRKARPELEKYLAPVDRFRAAPLAVRAVCVLTFHARDGVAIETIPAARAFGWLLRSTYRMQLLRGLGRQQAHFRTLTALARRTPVVRVARPVHPFQPDALAARVEERLREEGGEASPAGERRASRVACTAPASGNARPLAGTRPERADRPHQPISIVWLASYPKSGNTWLRAVLTNYLRDAAERGSHSEPASINALIGSPVAADRETFDEWVGLDSSDLAPDEVLRHRPLFHVLLARESGEPPAGERRRAPYPAGRPPREDTPAFVKVHDAYLRTGDGTALFPKEATAGVVYLVRNPLDVAVSYAHHLQKSIDDTVRRMNDPAAAEAEVAGGIHTQVPQPLLTWSGHVSSWLDQEELSIHVARYEDLLADPTAAFGAIVRFAGLGRGDGTPAGERGSASMPGRSSTSARLARAVDHAAFSRLRAQEEASGFFEKQPTAPSFFRAGVAGSWRTALTPEQVRTLVDAHGPVMARLGYLREAEAFLAGGAGQPVVEPRAAPGGRPAAGHEAPPLCTLPSGASSLERRNR